MFEENNVKIRETMMTLGKTEKDLKLWASVQAITRRKNKMELFPKEQYSENLVNRRRLRNEIASSDVEPRLLLEKKYAKTDKSMRSIEKRQKLEVDEAKVHFQTAQHSDVH